MPVALPARRLAWIDIAKGLGICLVVYGHAFNGVTAAGLLPYGGWPGVVYYGIYTFHMSLFFVLSGLTAEVGYRRRPQAYLSGKLVSIGYPYLLWCLIQGSIQLQVAGQVNRGIAREDVFSILWSPLGHFWFLYALLICFAVVTVLRFRTGAMLAVAAVSLALFALQYGNTAVPSIVAVTLFYFPHFVAGIVLSERLRGWTPTLETTAWGLPLVAAAFVMGAGANAWLTNANYVALPAIPAAALGVLGVLWVAKRLSGRVAQLFEALGQMSLSIYVMHVLVVAGTRIVLVKLGIVNPVVLIATALVFGLAVPIGMHLLAARFGLLAAFGLAPPSRAVGAVKRA